MRKNFAHSEKSLAVSERLVHKVSVFRCDVRLRKAGQPAVGAFGFLTFAPNVRAVPDARAGGAARATGGLGQRAHPAAEGYLGVKLVRDFF